MSSRSVAAVLTGFGGTHRLQLRDVPLPKPGPGEIVVQVEAASVNPIDVRRRDGYGRRMLSLMGAGRPPIVLGNDFAGRVCAVGRGVNAVREGDAVFGAKPPSAAGSHASHVVVKAGHAVLQPAGFTPAALAILPYNYMTLLRALAGAGLNAANTPGRQVLVHGASGGLGLLATAMLSSMGAQVTAVAGNGVQLCAAAGATTLVDRHITPLHTLLPRFGATLNFASWDDEQQLLALLEPRALGHATTVHPLLSNFDQHGLIKGALANLRAKRQARRQLPPGARYGWTIFRPAPQALRLLCEFAASTAPAQAIQSYRLDQVAQAHHHVAQRRQQRAVLLPPQV